MSLSCPPELEFRDAQPLPVSHLNSVEDWSYSQAFSRNLGILTNEEQWKLRDSHVAIAGMGGVGGVHLMTLARLGIGRFTIADPDYFETANFNRQIGARVSTLGRSKVEVMYEEVRAINPEVQIQTISEPIGVGNVEQFMNGADIFVDGVDFFAMAARRLLFHEARRRKLWAVTAGPHAFSTAWIVFDPAGMSFDDYFDIRDGMTDAEQQVAFAVGCVPAAIHLKYLDLSKYFRPSQKSGASLGLGCQLASGVVGAEVVRLLLGRPGARPAPWYFQFDALRGMLRKGRLWGGNRHPMQRLKRWWLLQRMRSEASQ
jgi:molybdopterin/thiamine biosynthesis adenylyltransferase